MSADNLPVRGVCVTFESDGLKADVEINIIVEAQHINNRKYNNSRIINDELRHLSV
jgi:hypothetical protein